MKKIWTLVTLVAVVLAFGFTAQSAFASGWVTGQVISADEQPVPGAQVSIQGTEMRRGQRPFMARAETNEEGRFGFRDVPAGNYIVMAMHRVAGGGRVQAVVENDRGTEVIIQLQGHLGGGGGGGENGEVETGGITGIVTFNDEAVADARVMAAPARLNARRGMLRPVRPTHTDENGAYELANVPTGLWVVMASKREILAMGRVQVEVVVDEVTEANIALQGRVR